MSIRTSTQTSQVNYSKEWCLGKFFKLFDEFLQIDAVSCIVYGREYTIIQKFYSLLIKISQQELEPPSILKLFQELETSIQTYHKNHEIFKIQLHRQSENDEQPAIAGIKVQLQPNAPLSQAFLYFVEATKNYAQWRSVLSEKAILAIYEKNFQEKNKFYGCECQVPNFTKPPNNHNKLLKPALIEFFNAISHLNTVYWNRADISSVAENSKRATHHFNRGTLDIYKTILKDFCVILTPKILEQDKYRHILDNIQQIRVLEYNTIGNDKKRHDNLIKAYQNLVQKILKVLKPKNTPPNQQLTPQAL